MSRPVIRFDRFDRGIVDAFGRGESPEGSFADSRNLLPTKDGALESAHGNSTTGGMAALPSGVTKPDIDSTSSFTLSKIVAHPVPYSGESPESFDGFLYHFTDTDTVNHYGLSKWYRGAVAESGYGYFDERKMFDESDVTITGASVYAIVVANAGTHGLSTTNDYYNGWRIKIVNGGTTKWGYIADYGVSAGTATFTLAHNIGSGSDNWTALISGGTFTVYRWFHAPTEMIADFSTPPGQCVVDNGVIMGSGGASSDEDKFPFWAGYINRTFFNGHASEVTYQGTYVDRLETAETIDTGQVIGVSGGGPPYYITDAGVSLKFPDDDTYAVGWTLEYDGFQESRISSFYQFGATGSGNNYVWATYYIALHFARMSKRVTAVNLYVKRLDSTTSIWSSAYHIRRFDILDPTTAELDGTNGWLWDDSAIAPRGCWSISGVTQTQARFGYADWMSRGETYYQRTGRHEGVALSSGVPTSTGSRDIVAWRYATIMNGRLFVGSFYDPTEAKTLVDEIRYSPLPGAGTPNYAVLPADRLLYEFPVAVGDAQTIKGILGQDSWLYVFKEGSIHGILIGVLPEQWTYRQISNRDGLVAPDSLVSLPNGAIAFADADDYKVMVNQVVLPLTTQWHDSYFALSGKSTIVAWYDKIDGSLRFTNGVDTTNRYVYVVYAMREGRPIYKLQLPAGQYVEFVAVSRDGSVYTTNQNGTFQGVFKWSATAYQYGATTNIPYLKTREVVLDEAQLVVVDHVLFVKTAGPQGTLDNILTIDGTEIEWAVQDKTKTHLRQKVKSTQKRAGRKIQVQYNSDSGGENSTAGRLRLDEIIVYGRVTVPRNLSV